MGLRNRDKGLESEAKASATGKKASFDVETKIAKIEASKMPDAQKAELVKKLKDEASTDSLISFAVYAQRKKIKVYLRDPMKSYPPAKGVDRATFEGWEEIYKNF